MVGDPNRDVEAGRKAGCRTGRILNSDQVASGVADVSAQSLLNAVEKILRLESSPIQVEPHPGNLFIDGGKIFP